MNSGCCGWLPGVCASSGAKGAEDKRKIRRICEVVNLMGGIISQCRWRTFSTRYWASPLSVRISVYNPARSRCASLKSTVVGMVSQRLRSRTCCIPYSFVSVDAGKESLSQHRDVLRLWYHRRRMRDYRHHSVRKVGVGVTPRRT